MNDLVGRQDELHRIDELIRRLPQTGGSLVLRGEAGIGKTTLGTEAVRRAVARGVAVISVTGTESEAAVPYAALQEILHPFAERMRHMRERPRAVLERAFGLLEGDTPDVFAVAMAALELLGDISAERGLLAFVDDAQWIDGSTARVFGFLARRVASDPLVLLIALRDGHPSAILNADLDTLSLAPLAAAESQQLLSTFRPELGTVASAHVLDLAAGNPLALLELSGDADPTLSTETIGDKVHATFLARLSGASRTARGVLLVAALDDGDDLAELQRASSEFGVHPADFDAAVDDAVEARALNVRGDRFAFRHPLVRSAIVSAATGAERRAAHTALASTLGPDGDRGIWHRAASVTGTDAVAADRLDGAATRAAAQGNLSVAHRAWTVAARLSPEFADTARRTLRAAEAAVELGRPDVAGAAIVDIRADSLTVTDAARLALLDVQLTPYAQTSAALTILVDHGRRVLAAGDVDLAIDLALTIGENLDAAGNGEVSEFVGLVAARLDDGDPRRLVVLATTDPAPYLARITEAVMAVDPAHMTKSAELLIRVRSNVDADPALATMQRRLLDLYRTRGQLRSIAFLQPIHTWNEITLANWQEALRSSAEGSRLATEIGIPRWGTGTLIGEAFVYATRGDEAKALPLIEESERGAVMAGAHNVLTGIQLTKGVNHLAKGRYEEAFAAFRRPFDPSDPSHHPVQSGWMLGDLAETAAHLGRIDEIRYLYARDASAPTSPWQAMAELYAQPFLAAEDVAVEDAFEQALAGDVGAWPTYRVRMLLEYGSWLRRRRRIGEARDRLRAGKELADALAMRPWSERARTELRAAGEETSQRRPSVWESLSPQELQVAELAARGLSNREIGERLFLSHRTVGSHLYRIFPKLGLTNRAQLASALAAN
ncbi:MAG TPA: AAA family ATPase [Humibacter sp.]|jgi:DNA-binding CsgD family transcriptional regulator|nr:AAA family ATPase [Humibacter sp.]